MAPLDPSKQKSQKYHSPGKNTVFINLAITCSHWDELEKHVVSDVHVKRVKPHKVFFFLRWISRPLRQRHLRKEDDRAGDKVLCGRRLNEFTSRCRITLIKEDEDVWGMSGEYTYRHHVHIAVKYMYHKHHSSSNVN